MTDTEEFLLHTVNDLKDKVNSNKNYDLLRATGLLRQLLVDSPSLIDLVNKNYGLKIKFRVNKQPPYKPMTPFESGGEIWEPILRVSLIQSKDDGFQELSKDQFLSYNVFEIESHNFKIKDIIRLSSNKLGGVHLENSTADEVLILKEIDKMVKYDSGINNLGYAIGDISKSVIDGLQGLIERVKTGR